MLVDFPATSTFLTPEERAFVIWRKSKPYPVPLLFPRLIAFGLLEYDNSSVGEEEHFEMRHLISALTDWQIWLHILIYMSIIGPGT